MLKKILQSAAGAALLAACAMSHAAEPMTLDDAQLDSISAGTAVAVPDISQFYSTGALAWAASTAVAAPGARFIMNANFTASVGLYNNGVSFTYSIQRL